MHIRAFPRSLVFIVPACALVGLALAGGCKAKTVPASGDGGDGFTGDFPGVGPGHAVSSTGTLAASVTGVGGASNTSVTTGGGAGVTTAAVGTGGAASTGPGSSTTGAPTSTTGTPTTVTSVSATTTTTATTTSSGAGGGLSLDPSSMGFVSDPTVGIMGPWYVFGDSVSTEGLPNDGPCEVAGFITCSTITSPALPIDNVAGFAPNASGAMCMSGVAAAVPFSSLLDDYDYGDVYGIALGLDLNSDGTTKSLYDATANHVVGFSFDITGVPAGGIRVEFPIPATEVNGDSWQFPVPISGHQTVLFADLVPSFTPPLGTIQPSFTPSMMESIQFHVPTIVANAIPVGSMCVSNLTAIRGN